MLVIPLLFLVWFYFDLLSFSRYIQFKPSTYSLTKSRLSSFLLSSLPSFLCSFIHEYDRSFSYSFSYISCIHFCIISFTYFNLYPIRNLKVTRTHTVTNGVQKEISSQVLIQIQLNRSKEVEMDWPRREGTSRNCY